MLSQESQPESITQMLSFPNDSYTIRFAFLIRIQRIYFHLNRVKIDEDIKKNSKLLKIHQILLMNIYMMRARVGPGRPRAGPGPSEGGPDLEGQGQGRQNQPRAGPDLPLDNLCAEASENAQHPWNSCLPQTLIRPEPEI